MILHQLQWPRMLSQDKLLQPLLRPLSLLSNSSPPPQCSSLLLPLPGVGSSLSSNSTNSSSTRSSKHLLPTNLQGGQVSSLLSSSNSLPSRLLQPISSRQLSLPNLQLPSRLSIKSSKMLWRASDQNVNKVLLKKQLPSVKFFWVVESHPCFHFRSRY